MATLEKIRSKAGLLVIMIGLALFAFIIGDFLNSGSAYFHQKNNKVAIVNGTSVEVQEYETEVNRMIERYKSQLGKSSLTEEETAQVRNAIFEQKVNQILMDEVFEKVGLSLSQEELTDLLMGDNISPIIQQQQMFANSQTGAFDKNTLLQFLKTIETEDMSGMPEQVQMQMLAARDYWLYLEDVIKNNKRDEKFNNLLMNAVVVNSLKAKDEFDASSYNVDFDYVLKRYSTLSDDDFAVSDSEIKVLYNQRKEGFKQEDAQIISYIAVDQIPSSEDYQSVLSDMEKVRSEFETTENIVAVVNENSDVPFQDVFVAESALSPELQKFVTTAQVGDVDGPVLAGRVYNMHRYVAVTKDADSIKVTQLTLPALETTRMTQLVDSIKGVVVGGKSFADVIKDLTGGRNTGEMGWMTEAQLLTNSDAKFKSAVWDAPVKNLQLVESGFGQHLVMVDEKTKPITKYKIATIRQEVYPSTATFNKLYNDLNHYVATNSQHVDSFKVKASSAGYVCTQDVHVGKSDQSVGMIRNSRPVVRWAFQNKKGQISDVFECGDKFVVAVIDGSLEKGYRPVAEVSELLKRELLDNKKAEKIIAELKSQSFSDLNQYAENLASTVQNVKFVNFSTPQISGIGMEPALNAYSVNAEVNKISDPIQGKAGVYVLKVVDRSGSGSEFNLENQRTMLRSQFSYRFYQAPMVLKEISDVEDNRIRFY